MPPLFTITPRIKKKRDGSEWQRRSLIQKGILEKFEHRSNKMKKNRKQWVKAAAMRAVKTVAQTAVATIRGQYSDEG
jgi:hypothetical protein